MNKVYSYGMKARDMFEEVFGRFERLKSETQRSSQFRIDIG